MAPSRFRRTVRAVLKSVLALALVAVLAGGAGALWLRARIGASLPILEGKASVPGLVFPARLERDADGVATLTAANRTDLARVTGFVHAQDRFFQMDLLRRRGAGELAELLGPAVIDADRQARLHGFRTLSERHLALLPAEDRALLEAYAEGVNAGLASLPDTPWEYAVLRTEPRPWTAADAFCVMYAVALELQWHDGGLERALGAVRDVLGPRWADVLHPVEGPGDAALDGSARPLDPLPGPGALDFRQGVRAAATTPPVSEDRFAAGSNAFALAGTRTASGAALLANDMHLGLAVPNIWYRVRLKWTSASGEPREVTGVSLPGGPLVVAGSNGRVAWGFTHAGADTSDLVVVDVNSIAPESYYAFGKDMREFEDRREEISVRGAAPVPFTARWTAWGPVIGTTLRQRPLAMRWVLHEPGSLDLSFRALEEVATAREAVEAVRGRPGLQLNLLAGDHQGSIGWTVTGWLPRRRNHDGRFPVTWAYGDRGWDGVLSPAETPARIDPADGQLYNGNARPVGGDALAALGDGGYAHPARTRQIRDALHALRSPATPADLLTIQLDDRALALERWTHRLQSLLDEDAVRDNPNRRRVRDLLANGAPRASADSAAYRLVREWRRSVGNLTLGLVFERVGDAYPGARFRWFRYEDALWRLLEEQPAHLLPPGHAGWRQLELAAVDDALRRAEEAGLPPEAPWGAQNTARLRHPVLSPLPAWMTTWADMPRDPLPGDNDMPRVQGPAFGASERLVVSPGREHEGYLHMPGGQASNPRSPFFRAGHDAWVRGEPTAFLPGPTVHTLTLDPAAR